AMTPTGRMVVVEHLRDSWNFISYNIGAFHFHSRSEWLNCFRVAGFAVEREKKLTPFITAFFLKKNGTES
ncbi:MAG: methyltransferase, partial [Pyrinomonadaceae bacterium]